MTFEWMRTAKPNSARRGQSPARTSSSEPLSRGSLRCRGNWTASASRRTRSRAPSRIFSGADTARCIRAGARRSSRRSRERASPQGATCETEKRKSSGDEWCRGHRRAGAPRRAGAGGSAEWVPVAHNDDQRADDGRDRLRPRRRPPLPSRPGRPRWSDRGALLVLSSRAEVPDLSGMR
jgi:hypothetical protein